MGTSASAAVTPEARHAESWPKLALRVRWSGYDHKSPDLYIKVLDEHGKCHLTLHGGIDTQSPSGVFGLRSRAPSDEARPVKFYASAANTSTWCNSELCATGASGRKRQRRFISDGASGANMYRCVTARPEYCTRSEWKRERGCEVADELPDQLFVDKSRSRIRVLKQGACSAVDSHEEMLVVEQPDQTKVVGRRVSSELEDLVAVVSTRGSRPRHANGRMDMCGDMEYELKLKPEFLRAAGERARCMLLAMCTSPFWSWGDFSVGYRPLKTGGY